MKKFISKIAVLITGLVFLVSCSNTEENKKLIIFHAGSLSVPMKEIAEAFEEENPGVEILMEAAGSRECAKKITDLNKECDVMVSADYVVINNLLIPDFSDWNIKFAGNEMTVVYRDQSKFSDEINDTNWFEILQREEVLYGRSDPNSDPCGYRAVLTMRLAEKFYNDEMEIIKTDKPLIQKEEANTTLKGHFCRVLSSKMPLHDTQGNVIGIVGTSLEITQKKRMEEELETVNEKLTAALDELKRTQEQIIQSERLRALGQMASGIAHDFNNALTPILGYSDLLLNGPGILDDKPTTTSMLRDIKTAATDAAQTVRRLSEFYAPARKAERKAIDVRNLIDSTLALTRPLWKEEKAAKGINIQITAELNDVQHISGNESQLREMLTNLIFNAVDAMPKGGTITIKARKDTPFTAIEVNDTGTGMNEEVRRRCFEPFFTTKRKRGGGLGLSMVHGIVRQHEGNIEIQSEEGKGTAIIVRIPESATSEKRHHAQPVYLAEIPQLSILLIDDEDLVRQTIEACLKGDKHTVRTATEGKHGIEMFTKDHFDIVITDRAMPGVSGDQVAIEIKKINPNVPIIMLTGFGHIMKDTHQHPHGVDLVINKPITRDALREALAKAIAHKRR